MSSARSADSTQEHSHVRLAVRVRNCVCVCVCESKHIYECMHLHVCVRVYQEDTPKLLMATLEGVKVIILTTIHSMWTNK